MGIGRLDLESPEYAKVRDELQVAEVALRDQRERVAELRRKLPLATRFDDQRFREVRDGTVVDVALSELFDDTARPLILMHFMFGKANTSPCPMCTGWADGYDGVVPHLRQRVNFAVLSAAEPGAFEAYGRERGWRNLRLVSSAESEMKRLLGFETEEGAQHPGVSVFLRQADGSLVHSYSQSADLGPDGFRGMDLLSPIWHFFDLTPEGRGDFMPSKRYPGSVC